MQRPCGWATITTQYNISNVPGYYYFFAVLYGFCWNVSFSSCLGFKQKLIGFSSLTMSSSWLRIVKQQLTIHHAPYIIGVNVGGGKRARWTQLNSGCSFHIQIDSVILDGKLADVCVPIIYTEIGTFRNLFK